MPNQYTGGTNVLERLWQRSHGDSDDECWESEYAPNINGGHCLIRLDDKRKIYIHRLAWEAHHAEPVPDDMSVLHTCDNPICFNPAHLYLGTNDDNIEDKVTRERQHTRRDKETGRYLPKE
jgi:hypothetical protein